MTIIDWFILAVLGGFLGYSVPFVMGLTGTNALIVSCLVGFITGTWYTILRSR